jgi:hypothetical protein
MLSLLPFSAFSVHHWCCCPFVLFVVLPHFLLLLLLMMCSVGLAEAGNLLGAEEAAGEADAHRMKRPLDSGILKASLFLSPLMMIHLALAVCWPSAVGQSQWWTHKLADAAAQVEELRLADQQCLAEEEAGAFLDGADVASHLWHANPARRWNFSTEFHRVRHHHCCWCHQWRWNWTDGQWQPQSASDASFRSLKM